MTHKDIDTIIRQAERERSRAVRALLRAAAARIGSIVAGALHGASDQKAGRTA